MANFDDPSFFESSLFNFDPTHLAPPPPADAGPSSSKAQRLSISSTSPSDLFATFSPAPSSTAGFGPPPSLNHTSSPRSSASPPSLISMSDSELDDLLNFNNSSSGDDSFNLDSMDQKPFQQAPAGAGGFPLYLPNFQMGTMNGGPPAQAGLSYAKSQTDQLANMLFQQHIQQQQQQQPQAISQMQSTMAPEWLRNQHEVLKRQMQYSQPTQTSFTNAPPTQTLPVAQMTALAPISSVTTPETSDVKPKVKPGRPPGKRGPKPKDDPSSSALGGKHNKTERRYREKVQAAQSNLRDSVPALRVLYGTSTDEQRRTTDIKASDGSVDGLGEITRPNASAKTTIFVGARMYIELLQDRVASLQRRVGELEDYRSAVGGQEEFELWKADFERRDQEVLEAARKLKRESESDEDAAEEDPEDEEEDDVEPSPPPPSKKRKVRKSKQEVRDNTSTSTTAAAARVFAAFAMTFSFLPSAGDTFSSMPMTSTSTSASAMLNPSTGQIISRLPIITAEHVSRLLGRGLPSAAVPSPTSLVEWGWRILVGVLVAVAFGPVFRRLGRSTQPNLVSTAKEAAKYAFRVESPTHPSVVRYAAAIIGRSVLPSRTSRWYTILHLNRTAVDAHTLALLAFIQPETPFLSSREKLWKQARASITEDSAPALVTVLNLPTSEAEQYLSLLPPTHSPIESMADEVHLVRLNDLYARLFAKVVTATTSEGPLPSTTRALFSNLSAYDIRSELKSTAFDKEIRDTIASIPKGSISHALGLVLIGLWGILSGPSPSSQAALATALAAEEMSERPLTSVSAMINLLYPGFSPASTAAPASPSTVTVTSTAVALDRLALVCIEYLRLVVTTAHAGNRIEASKRIGTVTTNLRLALAQTGQADETLTLAKERLVGVLSGIGRRAMSRVAGKDEDSGLDLELDEL